MRFIKPFLASIVLSVAGSAAHASCAMPEGVHGFAQEMANALNAERRAAGLPRLRHNRTLSQAALTHACDMQRNGFFDHRGSDGSNSHDRVTRVGYRSCRTSENIAFGYPTAQIVIDGWMNSAGHRRNMLNEDIREFGIGLAYAPGGPYAVLVVTRRC